jgi:hypothetical protein
MASHDSEEPDHANDYDYRSRYREVSSSGSRRRCRSQCDSSPSTQATIRSGVFSEVAIVPGRHRGLCVVPSLSRELQALGHTVRLMPPAYVKPYVKRQKNDAADAETQKRFAKPSPGRTCASCRPSRPTSRAARASIARGICSFASRRPSSMRSEHTLPSSGSSHRCLAGIRRPARCPSPGSSLVSQLLYSVTPCGIADGLGNVLGHSQMLVAPSIPAGTSLSKIIVPALRIETEILSGDAHQLRTAFSNALFERHLTVDERKPCAQQLQHGYLRKCQSHPASPAFQWPTKIARGMVDCTMVIELVVEEAPLCSKTTCESSNARSSKRNRRRDQRASNLHLGSETAVSFLIEIGCYVRAIHPEI